MFSPDRISNHSTMESSSSTLEEIDSSFEVRNVRLNPIKQISTGGIGPGPKPAEVTADKTDYGKQYLAGQPRSLSGIALRSFLLGFVLCGALTATIYLLYTQSPYWRLPTFLATLCVFHFLEFFTTARYNTPTVQISSFLLSSNGSGYNIAHTAAFIECFLTTYFRSYKHMLPPYVSQGVLILGVVMVLVGQIVRSVAMAQAGTNFNHVVQQNKKAEHQLVTSGLYGYLRHPSYFGFFWWGLGTQVVLGNAVCFCAYALVLWKFFSSRIRGNCSQRTMSYLADNPREKRSFWSSSLAMSISSFVRPPASASLSSDSNYSADRDMLSPGRLGVSIIEGEMFRGMVHGVSLLSLSYTECGIRTTL